MIRVDTMASENELEIAAKLAALLSDILMLAEPPAFPAEYDSAPNLQGVYTSLVSLRDVLHAVSTGDLSCRIPLKGYIGGVLKTLQANLKHLTWQTQMVADGDFSQRVDFMGEFADAFNAMVVRLDQTLTELVKKKTELSRANAELRKEIAVRKQTEAALRKSREELRHLAITDSLTGLYNRGYFNKVAEGEIERALRYSRPISIMMFDIDHFKRINDTFGHHNGDRVLKMVADTTSEIFRITDVFARYGGEEFIALLSETPAPNAADVADRLRRAIEKSVVKTDGGPMAVTASFGVSDHFARMNAQPGTQVLADFIATADQALYASKKAGRNRVTVFNGSC
jgi:diguanylate cyclase (GGDEF)-like protein